MDELSLSILAAEMKEDCRVLAEAASAAQARLGEPPPTGIEAAAFQLTRFFNVLEQLAARVAAAFENHIEDRQTWHTELIRRLSLDIPGVRPAFFSPGMTSDLRELRGFRHVFVHAYDLVLDKNRIADLVMGAARLAARMPVACETFLDRVQEQMKG